MGRGKRLNPKATLKRKPSRPKPKPGERRPVLMSLSPVRSDKILNGEKTIKLRRTQSGCEPNSPVVIYTSFPRKKIDGTCKVAEVYKLPLKELFLGGQKTIVVATKKNFMIILLAMM